eukprot:6191769-Pleurochrysis_carterae.AAC.1
MTLYHGYVEGSILCKHTAASYRNYDAVFHTHLDAGLGRGGSGGSREFTVSATDLWFPLGELLFAQLEIKAMEMS